MSFAIDIENEHRTVPPIASVFRFRPKMAAMGEVARSKCREEGRSGLRPALMDETTEIGRGASRRPRVMPANAGIQNTTTLA
jgi:hypothetical protein